MSSRPPRSQYVPQEIEPKWQTIWAERGVMKAADDSLKPKFYDLVMYPYPSGDLTVGHARNYVMGDVLARMKRMQGFEVLHPFGWDAFGLPAENAAMKRGGGLHPATWTHENIAKGKRELKLMGFLYDWDREVTVCEPDYYRWTQWLFLLMYERGLAYRAMAPVNWCPVDKTVLANEQVINGRCWRHPDVEVEKRDLEQWFLKITDYAERLLDDLSLLDKWPHKVRVMQTNWIGRSVGAEVDFAVDGMAGEFIRIYTTRPDTLFGATFMVVAPEHPLVERLTTDEHRVRVREYIEKARKETEIERLSTEREKTGVATGGVAINPTNGERIPIWVADYVLVTYGTGAIMAVPAHDKRDFEFATAFQLPIRTVVRAEGAGGGPLPIVTEDGTLVNSGEFDGLACREGGRRIVAWLEARGLATPQVQYRLHDWCISRQRYWGPPIPVIYCDRCGPVAVPERDLPVELPLIEDFRPDASGVSPLARHKEWYFAPCPQCGAQGRRETDVSDTFLDSAWYFLRYPSTEFHDRPWDEQRTRTWLPVSTYIGGNEHAVLHLLYSRFITMALQELGHVHFDEPFPKLRAHGLIIKDGAKMSKSRGNVVIPDAYIQKWGADTFRMYLMFLGPFQEGGDFRETGIIGIRRFLDKVWQLAHEAAATQRSAFTPEVERKLHQTIRKVTADTESLDYNTAIAAMMEYVNVLRDAGLGIDRKSVV